VLKGFALVRLRLLATRVYILIPIGAIHRSAVSAVHFEWKLCPGSL
jgi:hypothetical protein